MLLSWSYSVQRVILINVYSDHWQRTILTWQCHEILTIFLLKRFDLGPIWTGENSFMNYFFFAKIFAKNRCLRSQRLRRYCVSVFNNYMDIVSLTMLTHRKLFYFGKSKNWQKSNQKCHLIFSKNCVDTCWNSQWLRGHFWKIWSFLTDFKGTISQKKVFRCVYTSNNNNLKIWKSPHLKTSCVTWI